MDGPLGRLAVNGRNNNFLGLKLVFSSENVQSTKFELVTVLELQY